MLRLCFLLSLSVLFFNCNPGRQVDKNEKFYIYIDGRDTSRLRLLIYENRFYGELTHLKGGVAPTVGQINGDIKGDTLIGDNHYRPYRWKEKKRVPIVLMKQGDNYVEGNGQMIDLMGVLTYIAPTITFDKPKRIYKLIKE